MTTIQPGDRVRVVAPDERLSFGDYTTGDTAVVVRVRPTINPTFQLLDVRWETNALNVNEAQRCPTLYVEEVEVIGHGHD